MTWFFKRALADAHHRLENDREHGGLKPEEQRRDDPDLAEQGIDMLSAMIETTPGRTNSTPAITPPAVRCISQPI